MRNRRAREQILDRLAGLFPSDRLRAPVHHVEHHAAHLSSAFHVSPFRRSGRRLGRRLRRFRQRGMGRRQRDRDQASTDEFYFPHSLGIFYQALTQYLGFPHYGDEYKVMGLAPTASPVYLDSMRQLVRLSRTDRSNSTCAISATIPRGLSYQWDETAPPIGDLFSPALEELLGPRRRAGRPLERSASRHRALGAGDVRRSVLQSDRHLAGTHTD